MAWILKCCGDYFRLCFFACAILLGLQVPNFMVQYEQRVDAQLIEAKSALSGFAFTANRYFEGDLNKLIAHYRASDDVVFQQDANSIEGIVERVAYLEQESNALNVSSILKGLHIVQRASTDLFAETLAAFAFNAPLSINGLLWGLSLAVFLMLLLDGSTRLCKSAIKRRGGHTHNATSGRS
ncbi:DUF2937 family protein [Glaciecola sp. XM2]|jgi:hypothetical protein|uniref:DUF2937 family protein n=1 Tax=Glaciecola sp. XM2 TaxID=1914931 RepID=UPI001BDDDFBC|nr:DUF2937 family protein [Glaciecola sp. XM2]MBT1449938.1 DUF2937 family protein [Glaciecola sp. XM2]